MTVGYGGLVLAELPLWIADAAGYTAQNGLNVDLKLAPATTGMAAILSGQIQLSGTGANEVLNASGNGADLLVLANISPKSGFRLEVPAAITSAEQLKGKKVGVTRFGSTSDAGMRVALTKVGLDPAKDVSFVQLNDSAGTVAGLLSGAVQAIVSSPPDVFKLEAQGVHALIDLSKEPDVTSADVIIAGSKAWLYAHREASQKYMDSIVQAEARQHSDRALTQSIIKKYLKIDDQVVLEKTVDYINSAVPVVPYAKSADFTTTLGVISAANAKMANFQVEPIIDSTFLKSAEERGLAKG